MEVWQKQLIRRLFHYSVARMNIEGAFQAKHPHMPAYLYKYRDFSEAHVDALKRGVLFVSPAKNFNDPYEISIKWNENCFKVEDVPLSIALAKFEKQKGGGSPYSSKELMKPLSRPISIMELMQKYIEEPAPDNEQRSVFSKVAVDFFKKNNLEMMSELSRALRDSFGISSLSEINNSILMWSHYSNRHTGFCIEYDYRSLSYNDLRRRLCFPVFYRKKFTDVSRWVKTGSGDFNNLAGQYWCLIKNEEWAYEREWRIVEAIGSKYSSHALSMPKPSALIGGAQISEENYSFLRSFAQENQIKLKRVTKEVGGYSLAVVDA